MEALENRHKPEDYFKTYQAVCEIRLRIIMQDMGKAHKQLTSNQMQNSVNQYNNRDHHSDLTGLQLDETTKLLKRYDALSNSLMGKSPARLSTQLRRVIETTAFTDPFAEKLAMRILSAVHYFNPDLILADYEPSRRRLDDCMGKPYRGTSLDAS